MLDFEFGRSVSARLPKTGADRFGALLLFMVLTSKFDFRIGAPRGL
jgi:hypothetical protein